MDNPSTGTADDVLKSSKHLLNTIITIRAGVGDDLSDAEFTWLLQQMELPKECEFTFLGYCDRFVMLEVPQAASVNLVRRERQARVGEREDGREDC